MNFGRGVSAPKPKVTGVRVSKVIRGHSYDEGTKTLILEFRSGQKYRYAGVTKAEADALIAAESTGRYFIKHIRPKYPGERITT